MRYALPIGVFLYIGVLTGLHLAGVFPRAGRQDLFRLAGCPVSVLSGTVQDFPVIRWDQTRFVLEGESQTPEGFHGKTAVTLAFPLEELAPGDRLTLRGYLSEPPVQSSSGFPARRYWASLGVYSLFKVWHVDAVLNHQPVSPWSMIHWAWVMRQRFRAFWENALPVNEAALMVGLTIGGKGILSPELKEICIRAGVYHLVVVSGQNLAMLLVSAWWLFQRAGVRRRFLILVTALPLLFYMQVAGSDPPILRAGLMAFYGLTAAAFRRDVPRLWPLIFSAGALLVFQPEALFGASFQLSFAATAGLVLFLPRLAAWWTPRHFLLRWFWLTTAACLVVHLTVGPLLAFYFQRISLAGLLAPFVVFPLAAVAMVMGLAVGLWGSAAPHTVPDWLVAALQQWMAWLLMVIRRLASLF